MLAEIEKSRRSVLFYEGTAEWLYWDDRAFSSLSTGNIYQATDFLLKLLDACPQELQTTKRIVLASILEKGGSFAQMLSVISFEALICWVELASSLRRYFDSGDKQECSRAKNLILKIREIFHSSEFVENQQKMNTETQAKSRSMTEEL